MRIDRVATAGTLIGIGALHVIWATGSSFPMSNRSELADTIAGTQDVPGTAECLTVAAALGVSGLLVADAVPISAPVRQVALACAASVLAIRGLAGLTGQTHRLVPWTPSPTFTAIDRKYYGSLCVALAVGIGAATRK